MRYIDFDGVILDTEDLLFEEWRKIPDRFSLPEKEKIKYIQRANWREILHNSKVINDALYILKNMDITDTVILTKVHSLINEATEKVKYLREKNIKQQVIVVPYTLKKCEVVSAFGNILIDDSLKNLDEWELSGGYPMFFDRDENNIDSWNKYNEKGYQRVLKINEKRK